MLGSKQEDMKVVSLVIIGRKSTKCVQSHEVEGINLQGRSFLPENICLFSQREANPKGKNLFHWEKSLEKGLIFQESTILDLITALCA